MPLTSNNPACALPIGIFDSGVGGLGVAAEIQARLPNESLLYLGDLARLPYGVKSPATVVRYAMQAADFLARSGVKMLVVACNTASAHALAPLVTAWPNLPILGVLEAGAAAAVNASASGRIVVAATEGTCRSNAFAQAIAARRPQARVTQAPCPLFVALAEEGMTEGPIAEDIARGYLASHFQGPEAADCLVLGCTHFPLLRPALTRVLGAEIAMVDCSQAVADQAATMLEQHGLIAPQGRAGGLRLFSTDAPERFGRAAARLFPALGETPEVELIDL